MNSNIKPFLPKKDIVDDEIDDVDDEIDDDFKTYFKEKWRNMRNNLKTSSNSRKIEPSRSKRKPEIVETPNDSTLSQHSSTEKATILWDGDSWYNNK